MNTLKSFRQLKGEKNINSEGQTITLPSVNQLSYDLASVCRKRYSPGMDFILGKVSQLQLSTLLREATASFWYRNDLDEDQKNPKPRVFLYGCLYGVEGIADGVYYYDSATHTLRQIRLGDQRFWLQQGMSLDDVNIFHTPLCLHVVGYRDHLKTKLGYRGYRIQQMEAGMLVQRVLLVLSAIGIGGHPLLGFNVNLCDEVYKIAPQGKTSLIKIPIGPYDPPSRLEGQLHG